MGSTISRWLMSGSRQKHMVKSACFSGSPDGAKHISTNLKSWCVDVVDIRIGQKTINAYSFSWNYIFATQLKAFAATNGNHKKAQKPRTMSKSLNMVRPKNIAPKCAKKGRTLPGREKSPTNWQQHGWESSTAALGVKSTKWQLSPLLCEIFMENLGCEFAEVSMLPRLWIRYIISLEKLSTQEHTVYHGIEKRGRYIGFPGPKYMLVYWWGIAR